MKRTLFIALLLAGCTRPIPQQPPPVPKFAPRTLVLPKVLSALPQPGIIGVTNYPCSVFLWWDAVPTTNIAGYNIYFGASTTNYGTHIDVGNVTNALVPIAPNATYYIAARAYDSRGLESPFSNEVVFTATPVVLHVVSYSETNSTPNGTNWGVAAKVEVFFTNAPSPLFFRARTTGDYQ